MLEISTNRLNIAQKVRPNKKTLPPNWKEAMRVTGLPTSKSFRAPVLNCSPVRTFLGGGGHFCPDASGFCALNRRGNKRHAFQTIVDGRKIQIFRSQIAVDLGADCPRRFPVNIRKRFDEGFGTTRRQPRSAASRIAYVRTPTPQDLSGGIRVFDDQVVRAFLVPFERCFGSIHSYVEVIFLTSQNLGGAKNSASSPFVPQQQAGIVFQAAPLDEGRKIRAQLLNS